MIERTGGNPFFLEEMVRSLREAGDLAPDRPGSAALNAEVPPTVQAVLAARMDRLPLESKGLLQSAAVIGKDVPLAILGAIADLDDAALRAALAPLQAAELLYEASATPDPGYTFKHALTHLVAYDSLLPEPRRVLHARIVGAIEQLYRDRLTEQVETLAHHAVRGEVWPKAASYLHQAGAKALARSANREAAAYLEQALAAQAHLPESRATREQAIDLCLDLRHALFPLGHLARVLTSLQEAERLAASLRDPPRLGWAGVYLSHYFWVTGHLGQARRSAEDAQAIARQVGDRRLQVAATYYLALAYLHTGKLSVAQDLLRAVTRWCEGALSRDRCGMLGFPAVVGRSNLAWSLALVGAFAEARAYAEEGLRIAEGLDHPFSLSDASMTLGMIHAFQGDFPSALQAYYRSLGLAREWHLGHLLPIGESYLGSALALSGRVTEGIALLEQATTTFSDAVGVGFYALALANLGEAYLLADRRAEARAAIEHALRLTREHGQRWREARVIHLLAQIEAHGAATAVEGAKAHYGDALALATELGMRPFVAHCHLGLGKLYLRTGKRQQSEEHLATATTMYRDMDMGFWLAKAEAALALPP